MDIKQLEDEINIKTEILILLKTNELVKNFTLEKVTLYTSLHSRSKIKYIYALFPKTSKLKKKFRPLISQENEFYIDDKEFQNNSKMKVVKHWNFYLKNNYPEYINLLKK